MQETEPISQPIHAKKYPSFKRGSLWVDSRSQKKDLICIIQFLLKLLDTNHKPLFLLIQKRANELRPLHCKSDEWKCSHIDGRYEYYRFGFFHPCKGQEDYFKPHLKASHNAQHPED